jgi:hypothetical protein
LHRLSREEALLFVDDALGTSDAWPSPLIAYRLHDAFQAEWKCELGQWLAAAKQYGFINVVLDQLRAQAQRPTRNFQDKHPNDDRHLKLHQHVAASRVVHYFTRTGWEFASYESESGGKIDVDVTLLAPGGVTVEFQVKAPDQPGYIHNFRVVDGEYDDRVREAIEKGVRQLRSIPTGPAFVAVCANRQLPLAWTPHVISRFAIGSVICIPDEGCYLTPERQGAFFTDEWKHVSGIVILDVAFGDTRTDYPCTVLLNPQATRPAVASWFPYARVLELRRQTQTFRWLNGQPQHPFFPDGTILGSPPSGNA